MADKFPNNSDPKMIVNEMGVLSASELKEGSMSNLSCKDPAGQS